MANKPSILLGISSGHGDSSAALIVDGCLIAAAEEERFRRVKHYALFPHRAIEYCLKHASIEAKDVQVVAVARKPWNQFQSRLSLAWKHPQLFAARKQKKQNHRVESFEKAVKTAGLKRAKLIRVEHHLAHLQSVRIIAGTDDISLLSFDGMGDFVSAAIGKSKGTGSEILSRVLFPHSLGYFYSAMTQYLGFMHFGDEFKMMGLSSFGQPKYVHALRELIREDDKKFGFQLNLEAFPVLKNPLSLYIENAQPHIQMKYNHNLLTQIIGISQRKPNDPISEQHWDLAKSVQIRFEEVANHLLKQLYDAAPSSVLGLAGGCAHNSVWVGKIPQVSQFKRVLVAPAAHDAGIAVGAAALAAQVPITPEGRHWALMGPSHAENSTTKEKTFETKEHTFHNDEKLIEWLVDELSQKKIVGLFRGRMEFGPRALGSRSILADPRWDGMKDKLNARVKHREPFRPFAASVLWEHQADWFVNSFYCPAMEAVFEVKQPSRIPAVVHVDNTCRLQSVTRDTQPFYWDLIEAFRKKTGVPMLLNTSFNDCEPIVCTEQDVWNCFANTELDIIIIGSKAYTKVHSLALAG